MSASLSAQSRMVKVARQGNPREDMRRLRTFAWAVTALLICGSPLLSQWLTIMAGPAKATSRLRRLLRWLNTWRPTTDRSFWPPWQAGRARTSC